MTHLGDGLRDPRAARVEERLCRRVVHERPRGLDLQPNAGEGRAEPVVQLVAEAASFPLTRVHQLLPAALQVLLQAQRRQGRGHLLGDQRQDLRVSRDGAPPLRGAEARGACRR